jgi:hypothetical protein
LTNFESSLIIILLRCQKGSTFMTAQPTKSYHLFQIRSPILFYYKTYSQKSKVYILVLALSILLYVRFSNSVY